MIRHIGLIAGREVRENVRTKGFWISVFSVPVLLLIATALPALWRSSAPQLQFAVVDPSGWLGDAVRDRGLTRDLEQVLDGLADGQRLVLPAPLAGLPALAAQLSETDRLQLARVAAGIARPPRKPQWPAALPTQLHDWWLALPAKDVPPWLAGTAHARFVWEPVGDRDETELLDRVRDGQLFAYIVLPFDPIAGEEPALYVSQNLTNQDLALWFKDHARNAVRIRRLQEQNLSDEDVAWIERQLVFRDVATAGDTSASATVQDVLAQWAPALLAYLLWISVFAVAQMLLTTTVEEKSSKLADVLLATVTTDDLLAGKVIGVAITGMLIVVAWAVTGGATLYGIVGDGKGVFSASDFVFLLKPAYWLSFAVYFLLGYLLLASAIAGLGALTSSLRDAQNLMFPVQMLLMIPLLSIVPIARNPDGPLAQVLTWIPPFTPFIMMNRAAQPPDTSVYVGTTLLLLVSIWGTWRLSARLFRTGMLMSGGSPRLRDLPALLRRP